MAQVKIYARRAQIDRVRAALSDAIHGVFMAIVGLPEDKRFHRFIALDDADFIHPADRGGGYTVIKIVMFEGRSDATKRALLRGLMTAISASGATASVGSVMEPLISPLVCAMTNPGMANNTSKAAAQVCERRANAKVL